MADTSSPAAAPSTASVLEYMCLFTHDLKRKQKRWQDGRLRYHTFNRRVMVYDERGNFVGDMHWSYDYELDEGEEVQLERGGILVQVAECVASRTQDLSELIDKRAKEKHDRQAKVAARVNRPPYGSGPVVRPQPTPDRAQPQHRPLHHVIGPPSGHHGRAAVPADSPFEQRRQEQAIPQESGASRPAKRRRRDDSPTSRMGYAQSLFGATLSLSGRPASSALPRPTLPQRESSTPPSSSLADSAAADQVSEALPSARQAATTYPSKLQGSEAPTRETTGQPRLPVQKRAASGLPPNPPSLSNFPRRSEDSSGISAADEESTPLARAQGLAKLQNVRPKNTKPSRPLPRREEADRATRLVEHHTREQNVPVSDSPKLNRNTATVAQPRERPSHHNRSKAEASVQKHSKNKPPPAAQAVSAGASEAIVVESDSEVDMLDQATHTKASELRAEEMAEEPAEELAKGPAEAPAEEPVEAPVEAPVEEPAEEEPRAELRFAKRRKRGLLLVREEPSLKPRGEKRATVLDREQSVEEGEELPAVESAVTKAAARGTSPVRSRRSAATKKRKPEQEASSALGEVSVNTRALASADIHRGRRTHETDDTGSRSRKAAHADMAQQRAKDTALASLAQDVTKENVHQPRQRPRNRTISRSHSADSLTSEARLQASPPPPKRPKRAQYRDEVSPVDSSDDDGDDHLPRAPAGPRLAALGSKSVKSKEIIGFDPERLARLLASGGRPGQVSTLQSEGRAETDRASPQIAPAAEATAPDAPVADAPVADTPAADAPAAGAPAAETPAAGALEACSKVTAPRQPSSTEAMLSGAQVTAAAQRPSSRSESPSAAAVAGPAKNLRTGAMPEAQRPAAPTTDAQRDPLPTAAQNSAEDARVTAAEGGGHAAPVSREQLVQQQALQQLTGVQGRMQPPRADATRPTLANPATRGRKAALKSHAAGQVPQCVLPPSNPLDGRNGVMNPPPPPPRSTTAIQGPDKQEQPKRKMTFPGFVSLGSGAWSREASDLLEMERPTLSWPEAAARDNTSH